METVIGRVSLHPRGFGFLNYQVDGHLHSAFVAPPALNGLLVDDQVEARLSIDEKGRTSASGLRLVERTRKTLFGQVVRRRGRHFLAIDRDVSNTDWPLETEAQVGSHVVCRIEGERAVSVRELEPDCDLPLERLIARFDLLSGFAPEAQAQARAISKSSLDFERRRDLREVVTVTIDSALTRDIDDAIAVLPADSEGCLRLLVSIADPSEFIPVGSPLDCEARARGTSTYLAGRVLPMLPNELSSESLSLHPGAERLCLTAELRLDPEGHLLAVDLYESVIRSHARLTYEELADWLDYEEFTPNLKTVRTMLPWLRTAWARLNLARRRRGGVFINNNEASLTLDEEGTVTGTTPTHSTSAHQLVERMMVAANEAVAHWLVDRGVPGVFRVHPEPDAERVAALSDCARQFGFEPGFGRRLTPGSLAAFDDQILGAPAEPAIRSVMRRVLGAANYTVKPGLHLGLAAPLYLHFTSPLRRYADLAVHRVIKRYLRGHREWDPFDPEIESLSQQLNRLSHQASKAEAARRRMLLAGFMADQVGQRFDAHITRVLPFGMVAQLDASLVEGVIPIEALPGGPWTPREVSLEGPDEEFTLGQPVTVEVVACDPAQGRIEYALVD
ncbi:MAG: VacB/RNase II family 3'-5' exoribonuclease [Candidatus Eremiobacteraeota bacterium]|nr:VacB/RNase II family 3'-5' exoribonuclease [Candidatus Eremiobacteraeota bacterium]